MKLTCLFIRKKFQLRSEARTFLTITVIGIISANKRVSAFNLALGPTRTAVISGVLHCLTVSSLVHDNQQHYTADTRQHTTLHAQSNTPL